MYGNELVNPYKKFLSASFRLAQTLNYGELSLKNRLIVVLALPINESNMLAIISVIMFV